MDLEQVLNFAGHQTMISTSSIFCRNRNDAKFCLKLANRNPLCSLCVEQNIPDVETMIGKWDIVFSTNIYFGTSTFLIIYIGECVQLVNRLFSKQCDQ